MKAKDIVWVPFALMWFVCATAKEFVIDLLDVFPPPWRKR